MKKVLLIEDNVDVRELSADILELKNYKVATAENGRIGVEKAKQFQPDIIVCDIMMPELDGYEVLQKLSEDPITASIPFIFLTAKSEKSDMRKGMNLGADDYLVKPFENHELLDAVACRLKKNNFLKKEFSKDLSGINQFLDEASQYMELESLSRDYYMETYDRKKKVFMEGDAAQKLHFIQSGNVKTYITTESGREFVTGFFGPGDFFGQLSLFNEQGEYVETATVLADAEICVIPKSDFTTLLYGNSVVSKKFIAMVSNNLIDVQDKLANMAFAPVRQRAAKALLELCDKGIINDNIEAGIGIAREDFAGLIGTAMETAVRALTNFRDEGLIAMGSSKKLIILNKEELQQVADYS